MDGGFGKPPDDDKKTPEERALARSDFVQHLYTLNPNSAPPNNRLQVGELGLELADPVKIWVGVPVQMNATGRKLLYNSNDISGGPYLPLTAGPAKALTGDLYLKIDPPTIDEMATNKRYVDLADSWLQDQISAVASNLIFMGQLHITNDVLHYKTNLGLPDGPLPDPTTMVKGAYVIVIEPGIPPNNGTTNIPPLPANTLEYVRGDWFISDGLEWVFLPLGLVYFTASAVATEPPIQGTTNVQATLQWLYDNKLNLAGGNMTGPLQLSQVPTSNFMAAGKKYVDDHRDPGYPFLPLGGGVMSGGIQFTNTLANGNAATDLTNYLDLWGGQYGFAISAARLNYNVNASGTHVFIVGGADIAWVNATGLSLAPALTVTLGRDPTADLEAATRGWVNVQIAANSFPEPPFDGVTYGRSDNTWMPVLPLTAGVANTLTGSLWIKPATGGAALHLDAPGPGWPAVTWNAQAAGMAAGYFQSQRYGLNRWSVEFGGTQAESDPAEGTDFLINRFDNAGQVIYPSPLGIKRSTGVVTIATPLMLGGDPTTALQAVPKQYLDNNFMTTVQGDARWVNVDGDVMTGPLSLPVGTVTATALNFGQAGTGFYAANNQIFVAASGILRATISNATFTTTVPQRSVDGTSSAPGFAFASDTLSGIYKSASFTIGFTTAGVQRLSISALAITSTLPIVLPGDPTAALHAVPRQWLDNNYLTITQSDARFVNVTGDIMTGLLTLSGDPTAPLHAVPRQYLDNNYLTIAQSDLRYVNVTGDTMTGDLTVNTGIRVGTYNGTGGTVWLNGAAQAQYGTGIGWQVANVARFMLSLDNYPSEDGTDIGSGLTLHRFADDGHYLGSAFGVNRKTGQVGFQGGIYFWNQIGADFGGAIGETNWDVSKHIRLHWAGHGFSVTTDRLNHIAPNAAAHVFVVNTADIAAFSATGLTMNNLGIVLGEFEVTDDYDLSRHVMLYDGGVDHRYGFNIQWNGSNPAHMNYVAGLDGIHQFLIRGTGVIATINPTNVAFRVGLTFGNAITGNNNIDLTKHIALFPNHGINVSNRGMNVVAGATYFVNDGIDIASFNSAAMLLNVGLTFGNATTPSSRPTDLTRHLSLFGGGADGSYGFSITNNRLNIVSPVQTYFNNGGNDIGWFDNNGLGFLGFYTATLGRLATADMEAVPLKQLNSNLALYVAKAGDTMSGSLHLKPGAYLQFDDATTGNGYSMLMGGDNVLTAQSTNTDGTRRILWTMQTRQDNAAIQQYANIQMVSGAKLFLYDVPTTDNEAANKKYVDGTITRAGGPFVPITGGPGVAAMTGMLYLPHITPTVDEMATPLFYVRNADQNLQDQISAVAAGNLVFLGQLHMNPAGTRDEVFYKYTLSRPNGPLPPPSSVPKGNYVIVVDQGIPPPGSNIPALPAGTSQYVRGDWFISDGDIWVFLPLGLVYFTASAVAVDPPIQGTVNVQDTLQWLNLYKLNLAGGTMTGQLYLSGLPTTGTQAASKAYVDAQVAGGVTSFNTRTGAVVLSSADVFAASGLLRTGGTMTGDLLLNSDPTAALGAVTKQYVDAINPINKYLLLTGGTMSGGISFGQGTPASGNPTDTSRHITLWYPDIGFSITSYRLNYVVNTLTSHVFLVGGADVVSINSVGLTMAASYDIYLSRDPTQDMHAANKRYIDKQLLNFLPLTGGTMVGNILMSGYWQVQFGNAAAYIGQRPFDRADILGCNIGLSSWHGLGFTTGCPDQMIPRGLFGVAIGTREGYLEAVKVAVTDGRVNVPMQIQTISIYQDSGPNQIIETNINCYRPSIASIVNGGGSVNVNDRFYDQFGNTYTALATSGGQVTSLRMDNARATLYGAPANPVALYACDGSVAFNVSINLTWTRPNYLILQHTYGSLSLYGSNGVTISGGNNGVTVQNTLWIAAGINFNYAVSGSPQDTRRGITFFGPDIGPNYGIVVTGSTLNYNVYDASNKHDFLGGGVLFFRIQGGDAVRSYLPLFTKSFVQIDSAPGVDASLVLNSGSGGADRLYAYNNGSLRWHFQFTGADETGGPTGQGGSTFSIFSYGNDGRFLGQPFYITRDVDGGSTQINGYGYISKDPWQPTSIVNKRWVEANYTTTAAGDARWVNVDGDTMSGSLTINNNLTVSNQTTSGVFLVTGRYDGNVIPVSGGGWLLWNVSGGWGEMNFVNGCSWAPAGFDWIQVTGNGTWKTLMTMRNDAILRLFGNGVAYSGLPSGGNAVGFTWAGGWITAYVDGSLIGKLTTSDFISSNYLALTGGNVNGHTNFYPDLGVNGPNASFWINPDWAGGWNGLPAVGDSVIFARKNSGPNIGALTLTLWNDWSLGVRIDGAARSVRIDGGNYFNVNATTSTINGDLAVVNNHEFRWMDANGTSLRTIIGSDNHFGMYSTNAAGGNITVWDFYVRTDNPTQSFGLLTYFQRMTIHQGGLSWPAGCGDFRQGSLYTDGNWGGLFRGLPGNMADIGIADRDGNVMFRIRQGWVEFTEAVSITNTNVTLTLSKDPTADMHAVTRRYLAANYAPLIGGGYVAKTGDVMSGGLGFGQTNVTPSDTSRHIRLYDGGAGNHYGFSVSWDGVSIARLNYVILEPDHTYHAFWNGSLETVRIGPKGVDIRSPDLSDAGQLQLRPSNWGSKLSSKLRFYGSFDYAGGDYGPRMVASLRGGYEGGAWGAEHLDVWITNQAIFGADTDAMQSRVARFTPSRTIFDTPLTITGSVYLIGTGNDPMSITAPNGSWARYFSTVTGVRTWAAGVRNDGIYVISDEGVPAIRFHIDLAGNGNFYQGLGVNNNVYAGTGVSGDTIDSRSGKFMVASNPDYYFSRNSSTAAWCIVEGTRVVFMVEPNRDSTYGTGTFPGYLRVNQDLTVAGLATALRLQLNNGGGSGQHTQTQIALSYGGTTNYPHWIGTRHYASPVGRYDENAIDFWLCDGTSAGVFPTNGYLALSVSAVQITAGVPVVLPADPTSAMQAVTLQYLQARYAPSVGGGYVAKTGDVMSGQLTLSYGNPLLVLDGANTGYRYIEGRTNGIARWQVQLGDGANEGGGGLGSNFGITRFNDAGQYQSTPFKIDRQTGHVFISSASGGQILTLNQESGTGGCSIFGQLAGVSNWNIDLGTNYDNGFHLSYFSGGSGYDAMHINRSAGVTFYGSVTVRPTINRGTVALQAGGLNNTGYIEFYASDATTRLAYIGFADGSNVNIACEQGRNLYVSAGTATFNGVITTNNYVHGGSINWGDTSSQLTQDNDYTRIRMDGSNWTLHYQRANGNLFWWRGSDGAQLWGVNGGGDVWAYAQLASNNGRLMSRCYNADAAVTCYSQTQGWAAGIWVRSSSTGGLYFGTCDGYGSPNYEWGNIWNGGITFTATTANMVCSNGTLFFGDKSGFILPDPGGGHAAYKPGGGSWADGSDIRIKRDVRPFERGLDAILALEPVRYRFKGNWRRLGAPDHQRPHLGGDKEYYGLVAQHAEKHMPEMVERIEAELDGEIVDDLRTLDMTALPLAIVNAIKQLVEMNTALAARVATLEQRTIN